jgi:hypothetical protein
MFVQLHRGYLAAWMACIAACAALVVGCGTTRTSNTVRTATEQLLMSDAIDRTVQQIDFKVLEGQTVFFDPTPLNEVVDKAYLISSFRQHLLASGCILKEKREEATFVLEPRVGAMGTDDHDLLFGIPALQVPQVAMAPALPAAIPEIPFAKRRDQRGVAKVAVFAYRRETGEPVWQSGIALAESEANNIWLLGAGPFKRGTIYDGAKFAGAPIKEEDEKKPAVHVASVADEAVFAGAPKPTAKAGPSNSSTGVMQASAQSPIQSNATAEGPPVLPPPRPIAEAPKPDDPATTAG